MKPSDNIQNLIRSLHRTASPELDRRVNDDIAQLLAESGETDPAIAQQSIRRIIMKSRLTKLAAAAVIVIAVLCGVTLWPPGTSQNGKWWLAPSAAWGQEILGQLDLIKAVSCRERTIIVTDDGSERISGTWDRFYVSHDSYRKDIYDGDLLRETQWYVPDGNDMIQHYVRFDLRCYGALRHKGSFGVYDPVERMRFYVGLLDRADRVLDVQAFEGRQCIGFEISASKYGNNPKEWTDRIWFDVKTKSPVLIEQVGRPVTSQPDKTFTNIQDQFDYSPQLPADTFSPYVPQGFIAAHPDEIEAKQE